MTDADVPKPSGVVLSPAGNYGVTKETKQVKEVHVEDVGESKGGGEEQRDPPYSEKVETGSSHSSTTSTKKTDGGSSSGNRESSKDFNDSSDESEDESEEEEKKGVKETPEVRRARRQWKRNYYLAIRGR